LNLDVSTTIIKRLQSSVGVSSDHVFWELGMGAPKLCFFLGALGSTVFATDADPDLYAHVISFFDHRQDVDKVHLTVRENAKPFEIPGRAQRKCRERVAVEENVCDEEHVDSDSLSEGGDTDYEPSDFEHDSDASDDDHSQSKEN